MPRNILRNREISRPVYADRPNDDDIESRGPPAELGGQALALELRALVDVARRERRRLVGGRILDMTVHAAGAAVHDARRCRPARGFEHMTRALDVDPRVRGVALAGFAVRGGDVVDDLAALDRTPHGRSDR